MRLSHNYIFLIAFLLFSSGYDTFAQRSEFGIIGGTTYYLGDLNPGKQFFLLKPAGGVVYRHNLNTRLSIRGSVIYGFLEGSDAKSKNTSMENRNLSFKSDIIEFAGQFEINFFHFIPGNTKYPLTPYIFGGVALFKFNPKAELNGETHALQPLGTEGQGTTAFPDRKKYALTTASLPFGLGIRFNLSKYLGATMEWGMRKTFTDYIDDVSTTYVDPLVLKSEYGPISAALSDRSLTNQGRRKGSQRGNSKNEDWYSFAGITFTFRIQNKTNRCPAYHVPESKPAF